MKTLMTSLALAVSLSALSAAPAFADAKTEAYVNKNANMALKSLNQPDLTADERREKFRGLMEQFTDMDFIVLTVLDKYYRQFSEADLKEFTEAFRDYALATYEARLDQYRGKDVEVLSSKDKDPNTRTVVDSEVSSLIEMPNSRDNMTVIWRVVEFKPGSKYEQVFGKGYKVVDAGLNTGESTVWLAQNQKSQFQSELGRTNGDAKALIAKVREMTKNMEAEAEQHSAATQTGTSVQNG